MDEMRSCTLGILLLSLILIGAQEIFDSKEQKIDNSENQDSLRRSLPVMFLNPQNVNQSEWCSVAQSCERTMVSVCAYDERFGYSKFEDICHMLQVNCYWNYNFAFIPSCNLLDNK